MTHITTNQPITTNHPLTLSPTNLRHLRLPQLGIGSVLLSFLRLVGEAYRDAYLAPFCGKGRKPDAYVDPDLEGRDPSW